MSVAAEPETILDGWVLDWVLRPVEGASVAIVGGNQTMTDADGYYRLPAALGPQTIQVAADGLIATSTTVTFEVDGQHRRANFSLSPETSSEPRILLERFEGFIECSAFATTEHSHGSGRPEGENPLDCGTYATSDSVWTQSVLLGVDSVVIEVVWEADTELAERLLVIVDQVMPDGTLDYIIFAEGPSPLKAHIPYLPSQERFAQGGTIQLDVQIGGSDEDIAAGAAVQQNFEVFTSYFWNTLPGPDYTVTGA